MHIQLAVPVGNEASTSSRLRGSGATWLSLFDIVKASLSSIRWPWYIAVHDQIDQKRFIMIQHRPNRRVDLVRLGDAEALHPHRSRQTHKIQVRIKS